MFMLMLAAFAAAPALSALVPGDRSPATLATLEIYVDDDAPGDPGPNDPGVSDPQENGSQAHPFDTIQEALQLASGVTIVRILPGRYEEPIDLPAEGVTLAGSGTEVTTLRATSGTLIHGFFEGFMPPAPILSLSGVTVEGDVQIFDWSYNGSAPSELVFEDVTIRGGSFWLGSGLRTHVRMDRVDLSGAEIQFMASTLGAIEADVIRLNAPTSGIIADAAGTEGYVWVNLEDSVVSYASVFIYGNAVGAELSARNVGFTGPGISAFTSGSCFLTLDVEDSTFAQGGIEATATGGGSDLCGSTSFALRAAGSAFARDGIRVAGTYGGTYFWQPAFADLFLLDVFSNRFEGTGISATLSRGENVGEPWGRTAEFRVANNVFDAAPAGLAVVYATTPGVTEPFRGATDSLLEVVNNTFSRNGVGVDIDTTGHAPGLDAHESLLVNNIVAGGTTGLRVSGVQDHEISVVANDLHGNTGANYDGDLPDLTGVEGNISADPLFVDAARGELSLRPGSPCIDAGRAGPEVPATDADGAPRPLDGDGDGTALPDMGAFEFSWMDADNDGYPAGFDCDDGDPLVHPGAVDRPGDASDENCDGAAACDSSVSWKNHGQFVQCVSKTCSSLVKKGRLDKATCKSLVSGAARSSVGKPARKH